MGKTALIVDDSRSARVVLKRMLQTHLLDVDTAESAESALEYLSDHRPDVIFMDHLMPGMDGFQAVTAIKNNPDTATIPIMMYTSQEGEVYVGQARALGAVGVLPKQVEPVEVSKVLRSLRVISGETDGIRRRTDASIENSGEVPGIERFDSEIRELIEDLFDQQRAILRRDLLDSYEAIASRVADEIRPTEEPEPVIEDAPQDHRFKIAAALLGSIALVFALLLLQREQSVNEVMMQNLQLQEQLEQRDSLDARQEVAAIEQQESYRISANSAFSSALAALQWGVNQASNYGFRQLPLDDSRLLVLEELESRLVDLGFSGQVRIETHVGNFCMISTGPGQFDLAPDTAAVAECDQIGFATDETFAFGLRQSVAFANFINVSAEQTEGRIRYDIVSLGNAEPAIAYPDAAAGMAAGEWNNIAGANNRVIIALYPDSAP